MKSLVLATAMIATTGQASLLPSKPVQLTALNPLAQALAANLSFVEDEHEYFDLSWTSQGKAYLLGVGDDPYLISCTNSIENTRAGVSTNFEGCTIEKTTLPMGEFKLLSFDDLLSIIGAIQL